MEGTSEADIIKVMSQLENYLMSRLDYGHNCQNQGWILVGTMVVGTETLPTSLTKTEMG